MKTLLLVSLLALPVFAFQTNYNGSFAAETASGSPCDTIFQVKDYHAKHFLTGPSGLTSVLNFSSPTTSGFFHGLSFVGAMGGSNEILAKKHLQKNGLFYDLVSEGLVDESVIVVKISVSVRQNPTGPSVCTAEAEYTGF
jgi:hypothetical protein